MNMLCRAWKLWLDEELKEELELESDELELEQELESEELDDEKEDDELLKDEEHDEKLDEQELDEETELKYIVTCVELRAIKTAPALRYQTWRSLNSAAVFCTTQLNVGKTLVPFGRSNNCSLPICTAPS
jgi:hypothetical protein